MESTQLVQPAPADDSRLLRLVVAAYLARDKGRSVGMLFRAGSGAGVLSRSQSWRFVECGGLDASSAGCWGLCLSAVGAGPWVAVWVVKVAE